MQDYIYYIVPGSQTNINIDSALLIPDLVTIKEKKFKIIFFQIKQGNIEIKNKKEYICSSFIAKKKFEELYNIKISRVFFYFILCKEFKNDKAINDLIVKKISFLFFSYIDGYLYQTDNFKVQKILDLINPNSEIFQIEDKNEELNLLNKFNLINKLESSLINKSLLGKKITRNSFENGRKIFFKNDQGIRVKNEQREHIINFIKENFNMKNDFTLKYVFYVEKEEVSRLNNYEDLFGIYYFDNKYFIIHQSLIIELDCINIKDQSNELNINNNVNKNPTLLIDIMKSFKKVEKKICAFKCQKTVLI